jgi:hypothetical protein
MNYTVKITGGAAEGPFSLYYDTVTPANILASGLSWQDLVDGYEIYGVSDTATKILIVNLDLDCLTTSSYNLPSPTPTPTLTQTLSSTPTPTPTVTVTTTPTNTITPGLSATPTPTPTLTLTATPTPTATYVPPVPPTYFDSNYTGYESSCIQSEGWAYTRLISAPMATVTVQLVIDHLVNDIVPGQSGVCAASTLYETILPSATPTKYSVKGGASAAIGVPPGILYDTTTFNLTTNTSGYIDLLLTYSTQNLLDGYSNGSAKLTIKSVNGQNITNGDVLECKYLCTNLINC